MARQPDDAASSTPRRGSLTALLLPHIGAVRLRPPRGTVRLRPPRGAARPPSVFSIQLRGVSSISFSIQLPEFSVPSVCVIVRAFCICLNSVFNSVVHDMYVQQAAEQQFALLLVNC
jgi:hypothetical protein